MGASPGLRDLGTIAQCNANGGLNVFIVHSGVPEFRPGEDVLDLKAHLMAAFIGLHKGYQIKRVMVEAFGLKELAFYAIASLFHPLKSYNLTLQASRCSFLLELTRKDVTSMPTHPLLPIFAYTHPRCFFAPGEKELLERALEGNTDEELAIDLGLSLSAIKKRWARIFERSEGCIPDFVSASRQQSKIDHGRGAQRRHLLLRYIRTHPEEVAPYDSEAAVKSLSGRPSGR